MRYNEEQLNKLIFYVKKLKKFTKYCFWTFFLCFLLLISPTNIQVILALPYVVLFTYTFIYGLKYEKNWLKFEKNWPNVAIADGQSMLPTINDFDILIKKKFSYGKTLIKKGDIIVFSNDKLVTRLNLLAKGYLRAELVKRVSSVEKDGVFVRGDNQVNSLDSRDFGLVNFKDIKFVITEIIEPIYWGNDKYTFRSKSLHNPHHLKLIKKINKNKSNL